ncbi:39S ribosomal protein L22, mitochondrial [Dermacentor silvarum]|uniref:39S ribosomal protein L22, mitochondrial n=1 Tax=Dermacentor silvarum TaxID=543639 RepID=UPI00189702DE|nr:39S ribosomal protein L22, mitochondrial [Dermacentor silvarum]
MLALCRQALHRVLAAPVLGPTSGLPAAGQVLLRNNFSVAASLCKLRDDWFMPAPRRWPKKNDEIEPPQEPGQPRNEAWVVHYRNQIRYSPKKMLPIAQMIRGMSVDEAIKQLTFVHKKGAKIVIEVLKEAQDMAVRDHNVEYRSNLWVAESFCNKAVTIKGIRRHARAKLGTIHYRYCHYFVRLVEGPPPEHYYDPPLTPSQKLEEFIQELRDRRVKYGR